MRQPRQNTVARSLHDAGLAAWFGGSLMGAVGLNSASDEIDDLTDRTRVANAGWGRWTPVNAAAIAAHVLGGLQLTRANKGRLAIQRGSRSVNAAKAGLTVAALGSTAYARYLGQKVMDAETYRATQVPGSDGMPVTDATTPAATTDPEAAGAQRQLRAFQWAVPALTGGLLVLNAKAGEQQRPGAVITGALESRVTPGRGTVGALAAGFVALSVAAKGIRALTRRTRTKTARDIMTPSPERVREHETLADAARKMARLDVGALPICRTDDRVVGMLTDRDIAVKAVAQGRDPNTATVGEFAQGSPVTIDVRDSVVDAFNTMAEHKVRRLPVTEDQRLVGIISQADVAINLDDAHVGDLVETISRD